MKMHAFLFLCLLSISSSENIITTFEVLYIIQNYWVFGLCLSSGILKTRKQRFGNCNCFRPQVRGGGDLLYWVRLKELTSITGQPMSDLLQLFKYLPFHLCTNVRALSQFLLHIFQLSPFDIAWSQVFI
jgi:hypothetical protein